ncbi:MAG: hypothetical protein NZU63_12890 [Gemmataceae bacterium]|nr:hypothetical protein [Gemmataceae bacterium]MDW8244326.1 hypothetical protein [Thermogemmata sp.]
MEITTANGTPGRIHADYTSAARGLKPTDTYIVETTNGEEIWHTDEVALPSDDDE